MAARPGQRIGGRGEGGVAEMGCLVARGAWRSEGAGKPANAPCRESLLSRASTAACRSQTTQDGQGLGPPAPGRPSPSQGSPPEAEGRAASPRSSSSWGACGGRPARTLNFSGVQSLRRRLRLPSAPALPPDARSPAVVVQPGIGGARSLRVSLGERIAAPVRAAGGETRARRQGPGHPAPAQPTAGKAERRGGAGRGAGSPWTCVGLG